MSDKKVIEAAIYQLAIDGNPLAAKNLEKALQQLETELSEVKKDYNNQCKTSAENLAKFFKVQLELNNLRKENEWISVSDRLPEEAVKVLINLEQSREPIQLAFLTNGGKEFRNEGDWKAIYPLITVTYWKPITPPQE